MLGNGHTSATLTDGNLVPKLTYPLMGKARSVVNGFGRQEFESPHPDHYL